MTTYFSLYENATCLPGSLIYTQQNHARIDEITLPLGVCSGNGSVASNSRRPLEEFKVNAWYMSTPSNNATLFTEMILNDTCVQVGNSSLRANCWTKYLTVYDDTNCSQSTNHSTIDGTCSIAHGLTNIFTYAQMNCTGLLVQAQYNVSRNTSWPTSCDNRELFTSEPTGFTQGVTYAKLTPTHFVADTLCTRWNDLFVQTNCSENVISLYLDSNCSALKEHRSFINCSIPNPLLPTPKWLSTYTQDNCSGILLSSELTTKFRMNSSCINAIAPNDTTAFAPNAWYFTDSNSTRTILANQCVRIDQNFALANCSHKSGTLSIYQDSNCTSIDINSSAVHGNCTIPHVKTFEVTVPLTRVPVASYSPTITFINITSNLSTTLAPSTLKPQTSTSPVTLKSSAKVESSGIANFIAIVVLLAIVILLFAIFYWKRCRSRHHYANIH